MRPRLRLLRCVLMSESEAMSKGEGRGGEAKPVAITAIHLDIRRGGECWVRIEYAGRWIDVIHTAHSGGHTSHIVERSGMLDAIRRSYDAT
jgi:hypothetical protein